MAKSENQKLKLLYLKKIFEERTDEEHPITIAQIADRLKTHGIEAERKSLYRDIALLQEFGMDIVPVRSRQYGYYLGSREFELPELKMLVDAVQSSRFITRKKSGELIKKLESLTSVYSASQLQQTVYVLNRIKSANESIYYNVDSICAGIAKNLRISFKYFDWTADKKRSFRRNGKKYIVSPWSLTWDDEMYYLVAYDSDEAKIKHFRVDKMMNIETIDEERDGLDAVRGLDMAVYARKFFGMFSGSEETVTLRCNKKLAGVIIDRFGRDITLFGDDDEHFKVNINVAISPVFLAWVFTFGADMTIVSPRGVINRFKEMAQNAADLYE